ncbi:hypothetical protein CRE_14766 [Caenorhabditis remanei]|uniref:Uncharacterized protein n=1 Tax=Caenorhabditis remanei TaxID=31234 RepID=E3MRT5_CAERE|nr:hypothetical protein CRE_14766 [Caenorhabditis remanei]
MNTRLIFTTLLALLLSSSAQQRAAQQLAAYRQQQYFNWWYNQQRAQQAQQLPAQPQLVAQTTQPPQWFGNAQSDNKGNSWLGDDNAKFLLVARSSWP